MQLTKKLTIFHLLVFLLIIAPGFYLLYVFARERVIKSASDELSATVSLSVHSYQKQFENKSIFLEMARELVLREFSRPQNAEERSEISQILSSDSTGTRRSDSLSFQPDTEAAVYIPDSSYFTDERLIEHFRVKKLFEVLGKSVQARHDNLWLLTPEGSEVIYWPARPEYLFNMNDSLLYSETPWVQLANPHLNPKRTPVWTIPLYDKVSHSWMISCLIPIDYQNRWYGSIGTDLELRNILRRISESKRFVHPYHFLLDSGGNFILAGPYQNEIEQPDRIFRPNLDAEPDLAQVLRDVSFQGVPEAREITFRDTTYLAVLAHLPNINWDYVILVQESEILGGVNRLFTTLLISILAIVLLITLVHITGMRLLVLKPLLNLYRTVKPKAGKGEIKKGSDEIEEIIQQYGHVAQELQRTNEEYLEVTKFANDHAPLGILRFTRDGMLIYANDTAANLLRNKSLTAEKKMISEILPEMTKQNWEAYSAGLKSEGASTTELHLDTAESGRITLEITAYYAEYSGEEFVFAFMQDITERKENEEQLKKLFMAVEQSPVITVITDTDGYIEYVNPQFIETTGYTREEVLGKNPRILKSGRTPFETYKLMWYTIRSGETWTGDFCNRKKNGEFYWETASISPLKNSNGEITHYIAMKEIVTDRKKLEEDLQEAIERSQESNRLKSSLLTNMSHELRTPMNGIIGYAELLTEELDDPALLEFVRKIRLSSDRLMATLNSILDLSILEANKSDVDLSEIEMGPIIERVLNRFENQIRDKQLWLYCDIADYNVVLYADRAKVDKILSNLIDNAVKFTFTGGIEITVTSKENPETGRLTAAIAIKDTGIGISKADQLLVFDEFRQVSEGYNRSFEGTGLGLTIARKMARLIGGDIYLESSSGKGTTFTVVLPARRVEEIREEKPPMLRPVQGDIWDYITKHGKPQVLLVEDNRINKDLFTMFLEPVCSVEAVGSGQLAYEMCRKEKFDFILLDINLGEGINGVDTMRLIRALPHYAAKPIIAMTGYTLLGDEDYFLTAGFSHYLAKPFTKDALLRLTESVLLQELAKKKTVEPGAAE